MATPSLSLKQIRYFRAAAEAGKVSAAAALLGISQSAVTLAIKDLEEQLGVILLERRPGGVSLTREGQNFLGHARSIETAVADALTDMRSDRADVSGTVRLGCTNASAGYFMVPRLARFRRSNPQVKIELIETDRPGLEQAVIDGRVDLGLILTSNLARTDLLEFRTVLRSPRGLWVSPNHPLAALETVSVADVLEYPYILYVVDEADRIARGYMAERGLKPDVLFETDSLEGIRGLVATGFGVTILSRMLHRPWSLDGGRIEWRDLSDAPPSMDIGMVWRAGRTFGEAERRLLETFETGS